MNIVETIRTAMYEQGRADAMSLQERAADMNGTELNAQTDVIPTFTEAVKVMNMLYRPAGFVCKSTAGRVVKLIQPYDSDIYAEEPEELPAQWGFVWSQDAAHALPFIALSTSPYMIGDCCTWEGAIYRSVISYNVYSPADYPLGWEEVVNNG